MLNTDRNLCFRSLGFVWFIYRFSIQLYSATPDGRALRNNRRYCVAANGSRFDRCTPVHLPLLEILSTARDGCLFGGGTVIRSPLPGNLLGLIFGGFRICNAAAGCRLQAAGHEIHQLRVSAHDVVSVLCIRRCPTPPSPLSDPMLHERVCCVFFQIQSLLLHALHIPRNDKLYIVGVEG